MKKILSRFKTFKADVEGSVTIEYVLWLPIMVGLVAMSADATMLMHQQTMLFDAARDASRQVALGQKTDEEAEQAVLQRMGQGGFTSNVETSNGYVTSSVSVPFSDVLIFGGSFAGNSVLRGNVTMWVEASDEG